ncbi:hypothetical protein P154DRAFT_519608 [Amniculicola lignicola CBS 123094]|uniref:DUF7728 domain-containing protein n=1 Tax=Amniculicola lignicola CBS 123094 TaxID=1392246 RepID=A0A6A5WQ58_9PLEO|nr:hypothetical protein P154DRAFT_519608 [Amniculicola lignicola CBS 123094]
METLAINPLKRTVALECPSCAVASTDGNALSWSQEVGNTFLLDFEVGEQEDTLDIDGVQLYPPAFGHFTEPFYVTQVNPHTDGGVRLRVTGYTFHYNSAETITEAGTELLPMTFRITSIESKPADPPALRINLLKDSNGRLMIASFQTAKTEEESPIDQGKECKEWPLLCKWKAMLEAKLNGMKKGCGKHNKHNKHPNPMEEETTEGKPPHTFHPGHPHHRPHHMGDNEGHRHHHAHHRIHRFIRRAFFTILIPILIGIFAGTLTYLIGMALGCAIAMVVAKVRGYGPYERVPEEDDEEPEVSDKEAFSEKEVYAELPEYDAPPVYEAAEKEVVEESK